MHRSQSTAAGILERAKAEPAELVPGDLLVRVLEREHPLYLPLDPEGVALHDSSGLDLYLARLAEVTQAPQLPVDVGPLVKLCRRHREHIEE